MIRQRFRSSGRRRAALVTAAMTGAALLGTPLIAASSAQASTSNFTNWSAPKPPGVYCFGIDGSGRKVSDTYGNYYFVGLSLHPALYNEREVVRLYIKRMSTTPLSWSRRTGPGDFGNQNWTTDIHGTVRPGRVCGSLQGDGKVLATVCIGIS